MQKKPCKFVMILSAVMLLASCATNKNLKPQTEDNIVKNKTDLEDSGKKQNKNSPKIITVDKNEPYLVTKIKYPQFEGKDILNRAVENSILSYYNEFAKACESSFNAFAKDSTEAISPSSYETDFIYEDGEKYSGVLIKTQIDNSDEQKTVILNSYNYDEKSKKLVQNLTNVTQYSYEELSKLSRDYLYKNYNIKNQTQNKEWIDSMTEPYPQNFEIFLIGEKEVTIFFEPYEPDFISDKIYSAKIKIEK